MRRSRAYFLVGAAAALAGGPWARARQEQPSDGPVIVGERKGGLEWFELARMRAALDGYFRYREERQTNTGQPALVDREKYYLTTLDLEGEGYVGHKNLLDVNGIFQLGVEGTDLQSDTPGNSGRNNSLAFFYDVNGQLLQEGPVPVTLYARHRQQNTDREFLSTVETDTTEFGAVARIRSSIAPTSLQVFHRDEDQTDLLGSVDYHLTQDSASVQSQVRLTDSQQLELSYTFDHINELQGDSYHDDYDRNDGTLVHLLNFGESGEHNLRSTLRFYDQTGLNQQRDLRWDELLYLRHSNNFDTQYNFTLDDREVGGQSQQLARGNASLRHQLFESLTSTAFVGGSTLDVADDFSSTELFTGGGLDYTKRVPLGRLDLSAQAAFNTQNNSAIGSPVNVSNEPHTFNDPFPVTLNRRNIVPGSIVVTDTSRVRVYQEGPDYTVQIFPDRADLSRVVGGAIADGQTVLISYQVGPEPANTQDTVNSRFSARYTLTEGWFNGVSVYAIYRVQSQSIDAVDPTQFVLDDINEWRYGVDYKNGPVTLLAERIDHASTIQPYDSLRLEARFDQRLGLGSSLNLSFSHEQIDYTDTDEKVKLNLARMDWAQRLTSEFDFIARLQYRDETDTSSGNTNGLEEVLELRWHRRQTSVYATINNSTLNRPGGDTSSLALVVGLRREF